MTRKTAIRKAVQPIRHMPGCDGWHDVGISCAEARLILDEHFDDRAQPADSECCLAPSRTQPHHEFDFGWNIPDDENECLHGCGVTWDRVRGAE